MKTIKVGNKTLKVKLAITPKQQKRGLMNIQGMPPTQLAPNEGMLFVYQREEMISFWMRNTTLPLSIAFIDKKGYITEIKDMEPASDASVRPERPAQYALEVNRGWFSKNDVRVGDKVDLGLRRINISIQPKVYTEE
jgi:uncharacterized membrane protein (UPF0127 family)